MVVASSTGTGPNHVAVIMDGNGRWAKHRGLRRTEGHKQGVIAVKELIKNAVDAGISQLSLFAFSSENWRRPALEVRLLIQLLNNTLENEVDDLHQNGIRLKILGDLERFDSRVEAMVRNAESLTADNQVMNLNIAINYGGRWDIVNTIQKMVAGGCSSDEISEEAVSHSLSTGGIPDPDLFIRTGGEHRISNFLIWQLAYTELFFTDTLWPDFGKGDLEAALQWYMGRERRFGRTSEQVVKGEH